MEKQKYLAALNDGKGPEFMSKFFTGIAFVSFNSEISIILKIFLFIYIKKVKEKVIEEFSNQKKVKKDKFFGNDLIVEQAPAPGDVYWS